MARGSWQYQRMKDCSGIDLGQIAYEAYGHAVQWTAYDGKRIASWEDQDPDRCAAWTAAGERVAEAVRTTLATCMIGSIPVERRTEALTRVAHTVELAPPRLPLADSAAGGGSCCRDADAMCERREEVERIP